MLAYNPMSIEAEFSLALAEAEAEKRDERNAKRRAAAKAKKEAALRAKEQERRNADLKKLGRMAALLLYPLIKGRRLHPDGYFDAQGRWYPSVDEDADDLTRRIRSPSRNYPYSYLVAARSRKHLLALGEVNPTWLALRAQPHAAGDNAFGALFKTVFNA